MEANARNLERIFDRTVSYQIPLFQRPYVWQKEKNWMPLWEDLQSLLDRHINKERPRAHFLGAVVLEQLSNDTGSIESRQVIDGQQRFTTLQLFMIAVRDFCTEHENEKYFERFNDLVTNRRSKVDLEYEVYKVWPTNNDRSAFKAVHAGGSASALEAIVKEHPQLSKGIHQIVEGYLFFSSQLRSWMADALEENNELDIEDVFEALWQVVRNDLRLVVIDLDDDDESQVIFETLNARGTQLLPADLIKNYLFRRGQAAGEDINALYDVFWKPFDSRYWRDEIKQGRIKRPRIDLFIQHYLTLMMREDIKYSHLFESFRQFVQDFEDKTIIRKSNLTEYPESVHDHLQTLTRYAKAFKVFSNPSFDSRLALFMQRLKAVDTATIFPLLLLASTSLLPHKENEFDTVLLLLESFLIRRMVCGLTTKNYNRLFVDAIRYLDREDTFKVTELEFFLKESTGESTRFPSDEEFREALINRPIYRHLAQYKIRAVLEGIDTRLYSKKSEALPLPEGLTIEHIMPRNWRDNWPIPEDVINDPERSTGFKETRERLLHTLGNLTLITGSLNPSLSNESWKVKRPELCKYSKLNLNRYFFIPHTGEEDSVSEWNEAAIIERGKVMADLALEVWPSCITFKME